MATLRCLIGIIVSGAGMYLFIRLDEKAKAKGNWSSSPWSGKYTFWQFPMYVCFIALAIFVVALLD